MGNGVAKGSGAAFRPCDVPARSLPSPPHCEGQRQSRLPPYSGLTLQTQEQIGLFCIQGQAHSPVGSAMGLGFTLRVQVGPAGVRLSQHSSGKMAQWPRLPPLGEKLGHQHRGFSMSGDSLFQHRGSSMSGDSLLSQLFDEGHLIPIPDTITEREVKAQSVRSTEGHICDSSPEACEG